MDSDKLGNGNDHFTAAMVLIYHDISAMVSYHMVVTVSHISFNYGIIPCLIYLYYNMG